MQTLLVVKGIRKSKTKHFEVVGGEDDKEVERKRVIYEQLPSPRLKTKTNIFEPLNVPLRNAVLISNTIG